MADKRLLIKLAADVDQLKAGMKQAKDSVSSFQSQIKSAGIALAATFGAREILGAVSDLSKLAGQAEGVRNAFEKLQGSARVMADLRRATQGTVSDLELMKAAVQADNFSIPVQQLGRLFEFAHQRAVATGQSVEYLTQSIVTGIGRKSPLILDNLGISAIDLKEKLKGVGTEAATVADVAKAVGEIAEASLKKAGAAAENAATKSEQVTASWNNMKVSLGNLVNSAGLPKLIGFFDQLLKKSNELITGSSGDVFKDLAHNLNVLNAIQRKSGNEQIFQQGLAKVKELAQQAGVELIQLKDEATGVIKIFQKPSAVTFLDPTKKELTKTIALTDEAKRKLFELSEQQRAARIAGVERENKSPSKTLTEFTSGQTKDPLSLITGKVGQLEPVKLKLQEVTEEFKRLAQASLMAGDVLGDAFATIVKGGDAVGTLRNATAQIVSLFAKQALAAAIAKGAIKSPLAIVGAAAGIAAMSALLSSVGISAKGGGGGGSSSGGSSQPRAADSFRPQPVYIELRGELRANGQDMAYTLRKQDYYQKVRG